MNVGLIPIIRASSLVVSGGPVPRARSSSARTRPLFLMDDPRPLSELRLPRSEFLGGTLRRGTSLVRHNLYQAFARIKPRFRSFSTRFAEQQARISWLADYWPFTRRKAAIVIGVDGRSPSSPAAAGNEAMILYIRRARGFRQIPRASTSASVRKYRLRSQTLIASVARDRVS